MDDLDVDWDIQPPESYRAVNTRTPGDADAVRTAADLLAKAERPMLLAGGGVIESGATEQPPTVRRPAGRTRLRRGVAGHSPR